MYLHLFDHTNILHIFILFIHCKCFHSLSHTFNNICTNSSHALTCIFTFFSTKGQCKQFATKLNQVPLPRIFILDELLYIHETLPRHIKKTTFTKLLPIHLINFSNSLFTFYFTSSDSTLSRVQVVDQLHSVYNLYQYPD